MELIQCMTLQDKKFDKDDIFNYKQIICEKYEIIPSFNYVKGTFDEISRISYTNVFIKKVIKHINHLLPDIVKYNYKVEIKANELNYILIIHGYIGIVYINNFISTPFDLQLVYLKTKNYGKNNENYRLHFYKAFIDIHNITYSPDIFINVDDNTNNKIITTLLEKRFDTENYCFIGGDSIIYSQLFEYTNAVFYIDSCFIKNYFMENIDKYHKNTLNINIKTVNLSSFDLSFNLNNIHMKDTRYSIVYEVNDTHRFYNILQHLCKVLPQYLYLIIPSKLKDNIPFYILFDAGYTIRQIITIENTYSPVYIVILS